MQQTVSNILVAAKRHEIDELKRLSAKVHLVGLLGHLIHALQTERGASSIFLASGGKRFGEVRIRLIGESEEIESSLREAFDAQLIAGSFGDARQFYLMAWVLLGLDSMALFRGQIAAQEVSSAQAVAAFSRLIAGLVSLIFEVTDAVLDPVISRSLVALFNFIQCKEHAGQERAVGALCFASGINEKSDKQRIVHLIEAQERCFHLFREFASGAALQKLADASVETPGESFDRLRRCLLVTDEGGRLDANLSRAWFDECTARLDRMWEVQQYLVAELLESCNALIRRAEDELQDVAGLQKSLLDRPPASTCLVDRFFAPGMQIDAALRILPGDSMNPGLGDSLIEVLLAQSARLANVESELDQAKRALNERKVVERAKGLLMARRGLTEDAAYRLLRQTAMEQNKRIVELAETMLNFQDWLGGLDSVADAKPEAQRH